MPNPRPDAAAETAAEQPGLVSARTEPLPLSEAARDVVVPERLRRRSPVWLLALGTVAWLVRLCLGRNARQMLGDL